MPAQKGSKTLHALTWARAMLTHSPSLASNICSGHGSEAGTTKSHGTQRSDRTFLYLG